MNKTYFALQYCRWLHKRFFKKPGNLLDVGWGYKATGFDKKDCDLEKDKIPHKNNSFDYILCLAIIEHISNYNNLFNELNRVLKPRGMLFITTFDFKNTKRFYDDYTHVKPYTKKSLKKILEDYGFRVLFVKNFRNLP